MIGDVRMAWTAGALALLALELIRDMADRKETDEA